MAEAELFQARRTSQEDLTINLEKVIFE